MTNSRMGAILPLSSIKGQPLGHYDQSPKSLKRFEGNVNSDQCLSALIHVVQEYQRVRPNTDNILVKIYLVILAIVILIQNYVIEIKPSFIK